MAAPTAGLHFTDKVLAALDEAGIVRDELTLHVGAGTLKPVKSTEIEGHNMHTEYVVVHRHTLETCFRTAVLPSPWAQPVCARSKVFTIWA